ncbi:SURF1 family protein [Sulfitobacter sp. D35]|uniref:SURF1 family protein n=1 Tax=Sulfitobacter sp. D35 TaxID=3083252 RepID=UPI00296F1C4A|nr:SURF1 family protein [Sulfitobacter sp. D35]MDW4499468.1 SURF1 family protein [Sulfitobacter sp. D35]
MRRLAFLLIFGLGGAAVLIGLGTWQMQRLGWKQDMLADIDARIAAQPVALPDKPDPVADRFLPVRAEGVFGAPGLRVLVSVKRVGAGYRLIFPFETSSGRRILLDRGFIPNDAQPGPVPEAPVSVTGNLHWPDESDGFTPAPDLEAGIWFARDVPEMAAALETEPVLIVARDVVPADHTVTPLPVDGAGIPNDHLQYAITWFSLAAIWLAMTAFFLRRGRAKTKS